MIITIRVTNNLIVLRNFNDNERLPSKVSIKRSNQGDRNGYDKILLFWGTLIRVSHHRKCTAAIHGPRFYTLCSIAIVGAPLHSSMEWTFPLTAKAHHMGTGECGHHIPAIWCSTESNRLFRVKVVAPKGKQGKQLVKISQEGVKKRKMLEETWQKQTWVEREKRRSHMLKWVSFFRLRWLYQWPKRIIFMEDNIGFFVFTQFLLRLR